MRKAAREAKRHTSWTNPNSAYEHALSAFVEGVLTAPRAQQFRDAARPFVRRMARIGVVNALAQLVVKIGSPGVVDVYQGAELWHLSLVDPDNRRAVDFARREDLLGDLEPLLARVAQSDDAVRHDLRHLLDDWPSGRIKLFVTAAGLRLRRTSPDLFLAARYEPLVVDRQGTADIVAFLRRRADSGLLVAVPRFVSSLMSDDEPATWPLGDEAWHGTRVRLPSELDGRPLRNVLTGQRLAVETIGGVASLAAGLLFSDLPVGMWAWGTVE
jgi:(1->4)-alpha-D-glucan 1-alpha-D-glucosylmutase